MDCQHLCGLSGDKVSFFKEFIKMYHYKLSLLLHHIAIDGELIYMQLTTTVILVNQLCLKNKVQECNSSIGNFKQAINGQHFQSFTFLVCFSKFFSFFKTQSSMHQIHLKKKLFGMMWYPYYDILIHDSLCLIVVQSWHSQKSNSRQRLITVPVQ